MIENKTVVEAVSHNPFFDDEINGVRWEFQSCDTYYRGKPRQGMVGNFLSVCTSGIATLRLQTVVKFAPYREQEPIMHVAIVSDPTGNLLSWGTFMRPVNNQPHTMNNKLFTREIYVGETPSLARLHDAYLIALEGAEFAPEDIIYSSPSGVITAYDITSKPHEVRRRFCDVNLTSTMHRYRPGSIISCSDLLAARPVQVPFM